MTKNIEETTIPEISAQENNISVIFKNFPVQKNIVKNEFIFIKEKFADGIIEAIKKKYSLIKKGLFKKKYYCANCQNEIKILEAEQYKLSDSIKVESYDINFIINALFIICPHCSNKLFSEKTNSHIFYVLERAFIENKLWPEDPDDL